MKKIKKNSHCSVDNVPFFNIIYLTNKLNVWTKVVFISRIKELKLFTVFTS